METEENRRQQPTEQKEQKTTSEQDSFPNNPAQTQFPVNWVRHQAPPAVLSFSPKYEISSLGVLGGYAADSINPDPDLADESKIVNTSEKTLWKISPRR
jgi:hypothetical protein